MGGLQENYADYYIHTTSNMQYKQEHVGFKYIQAVGERSVRALFEW
jgi:hypothetical protein